MRKRFYLVCLVVLLWGGVAPVVGYAKSIKPMSFEPLPREGLWTKRHWASVAVFAVGLPTLLVSGKIVKLSPNSNAAIGPQFDWDNHRLRNPLEAETVSKLYVKATVPTVELALFWAGASLGALATHAMPICDGGGQACRNFQRQVFFDTLFGVLETLLLTATITEAFKYGVGRLRPDFLDRYKQFNCQADPGQDECIDGRLSFISGHSSTAFAVATYASLVIGGRMLWGKRARYLRSWSEFGVGLALQALLMGSAAYIAASRIKDGRHHWEDVLVGSLVGVGVANLSYWLSFDRHGMPRYRGRKDAKNAKISFLSIAPIRAGAMFYLGGSF